MIHEDGAYRGPEELGCAKGGVSVEKHVGAVMEDQRLISSSDRSKFVVPLGFRSDVRRDHEQ